MVDGLTEKDDVHGDGKGSDIWRMFSVSQGGLFDEAEEVTSWNRAITETFDYLVSNGVGALGASPPEILMKCLFGDYFLEVQATLAALMNEYGLLVVGLMLWLIGDVALPVSE